MRAVSPFSVMAALAGSINGLQLIGLTAQRTSYAERMLTNGWSSIYHRAGLRIAGRTCGARMGRRVDLYCLHLAERQNHIISKIAIFSVFYRICSATIGAECAA